MMGKTRARIYEAADHPNASEHSHQVAVMAWSKNHPQLKWLHAVPNGGDRDQITAGKMKAEGVKSGVLDMFLPLPMRGFHGLYVELKKPSRRKEPHGGLSDMQIEFGNYAVTQGYNVHCCYSWREAVTVIATYANLPLSFDP